MRDRGREAVEAPRSSPQFEALDRAGVALVNSAMRDRFFHGRLDHASLAGDPEAFDKLFMELA